MSNILLFYERERLCGGQRTTCGSQFLYCVGQAGRLGVRHCSKKTTCLNEPSVEGSINEQSTDDAFPKGQVSQCDSVS